MCNVAPLEFLLLIHYVIGHCRFSRGFLLYSGQRLVISTNILQPHVPRYRLCFITVISFSKFFLLLHHADLQAGVCLHLTPIHRPSAFHRSRYETPSGSFHTFVLEASSNGDSRDGMSRGLRRRISSNALWVLLRAWPSTPNVLRMIAVIPVRLFVSLGTCVIMPFFRIY